jgi:hypothetical protein
MQGQGMLNKFVLLEGDEKIRVGNDTSAELVFEDDSRVKVYSNTELFLKEVAEKGPDGTPSKKLVLSIFSGKIVSDVKGSSNFYINTNACAAKINGTAMTEVYPGGATFIVVLEGVANVTDKDGKTVAVLPHQQVIVTPQKPLPKPTKIDAKILNELTAEKEKIREISFERARQEVLQSLPPYHPMVMEEKFKSEMARPEWQEMMRKVEETEKKRKQKLETAKASKPPESIKTVAVDRSITYNEIEFDIPSAEIRTEYKNRKSPEGKVFLILNVHARNSSPRQIFVFYDEEVRLLNEAGGTISLEDYKLETSFGPRSEESGNFLFVIPKENIKFKLQFGKKSSPKAELELDLVEKV